MLSTITEPVMFGLGIAPKENFVAYSTQFAILIIRLVPGNVVMVAIDTAERVPSQESGDMDLRETMYYYIFGYLFTYLFACLFNNIFYISMSAMFNLH